MPTNPSRARRITLAVAFLAAMVAAAGAEPAPGRPTHRTAPRAIKLVTRNVHYRRTSIGGLLFFGEIVNKGSTDAADVGVLVSVLNDRGERLARGSALTIAVNILRPGAAAVWQVQMTDNPRRWARTKVETGE